MTSTVLTNIRELVTNDPEAADLLGIVEHAALVVDGGRVAWVGPAAQAPPADELVDGRVVVRQGERQQIGRELDAAIATVWKGMA